MIQVEGITKSYGSVRALKGVSFSVDRGETLGVIGPNGAGKTTLLKILLGLVRPDHGSVRVDGLDLTRDPRGVRRAIGYVPQRAVFEEFHTGFEALGFLARLRGADADEITAHAAQVGVDHLLSRKVGTLSGGQRQRLSLAAALLGHPPVLLLDEPTASLDPEATATFRALIHRLTAEGRTMVLCSHLLADVERLCHRVLVLLDGQVAATETMGEVEPPELCINVADPETARIALAEFASQVRWNGNGELRARMAPSEMLRFLSRLESLKIPVTRLETRRPSLEERFMATLARSKEERHD